MKRLSFVVTAYPAERPKSKSPLNLRRKRPAVSNGVASSDFAGRRTPEYRRRNRGTLNAAYATDQSQFFYGLVIHRPSSFESLCVAGFRQPLLQAGLMLKLWRGRPLQPSPRLGAVAGPLVAACNPSSQPEHTPPRAPDIALSWRSALT